MAIQTPERQAQTQPEPEHSTWFSKKRNRVITAIASVGLLGGGIGTAYAIGGNGDPTHNPDKTSASAPAKVPEVTVPADIMATDLEVYPLDTFDNPALTVDTTSSVLAAIVDKLAADSTYRYDEDLSHLVAPGTDTSRIESELKYWATQLREAAEISNDKGYNGATMIFQSIPVGDAVVEGDGFKLNARTSYYAKDLDGQDLGKMQMNDHQTEWSYQKFVVEDQADPTKQKEVLLLTDFAIK